MNDEFYNRVGGDRIASRQIDELIGIAGGLVADGVVNQAEAQFLKKWLASNVNISRQPLINTLYRRVSEVLADRHLDTEEARDLFGTLQQFAARDFELGEALKATTLPLCVPPPELEFSGSRYCFTGTFLYGTRAACEKAVVERGGTAGSLTQTTDVLVIGVYATESWKHSAFGNKIMKAAEMRDKGMPISIVSEQHWTTYL